jgi:hypothetical protein
VITTLVNTAKPVTDLNFPTVTICGDGLYMENVQARLEGSFNAWRLKGRKSWDASDIGDLMADYMKETFQIEDKGVNILDILSTMVAPSADASIASNGVRENVQACEVAAARKRKKRGAEGKTS